jgi:hypothetical protein
MAKLKTPNRDGWSGKMADVVYYDQFGNQLARKVPSKYDDLNSQKQRDQRYGRFAPCTSFARQMKYIAKEIFQVQPARRTAFSEMVHQLSPAFTGTESAPVEDLKLAILGNGDLPMVKLLTCGPGSLGHIVITWSDVTSQPTESPDDLVNVMLTEADGKTSTFIATGIKRSVGTANIVLPSPTLYSGGFCSSLFMKSVDGKLKSRFQCEDDIGQIA